MIYTPKRKNNNGKTVCGVLLVCAFVVWVLSIALEVQYAVVWQVLSIGLICAALSISSRYIICSFVYRVEDGELIVTQQQKRSNIDVCRLPLEKIVSVKRGREKSNGKRYDYTVSLALPESECVTIVFDDGGDSIVLWLEADESFTAYLTV